MLGYLMHKHPTHVLPHCLTRLARGGHGVYSVCCLEKTDTPVCDDAPTDWNKRKQSAAAGSLQPIGWIQAQTPGREKSDWLDVQSGRWQGETSFFFSFSYFCVREVQFYKCNWCFCNLDGKFIEGIHLLRVILFLYFRGLSFIFW